MAHGEEHEKELGGSGELLPHLRSGWRFGGVAVPRGFICSRNPGYLLALDDDRPLLFETLSVSSGLISHRQPPSLSTRRLFPCANELNACSGSGFGHMLTDPRQSEGDQRSVLVSPTSQTSVLDSDMTARALAGLLSDRRYILLFQADRPAPPACAPAETCRETRRRSSHRDRTRTDAHSPDLALKLVRGARVPVASHRSAASSAASPRSGRIDPREGRAGPLSVRRRSLSPLPNRRQLLPPVVRHT